MVKYFKPEKLFDEQRQLNNLVHFCTTCNSLLLELVIHISTFICSAGDSERSGENGEH